VAIDGQAELGKTGDKPQVFRSPVAVAVWWLWVLFAVGNLIDIAVQGRDHTSAVAAAILVFVTGVIYTTAQLPKVVARSDGLLIRNPLRDHVIGWGTIVKVDTLDLLRVHCAWGTQKKVFHAWAVQHSRRREMTQQAREARAARRGLHPSRPDSVRGSVAGSGYAAGATGSQNAPGSPQHTIESLRTRLAEAREQHPAATPPVSTWRWQAIAAIVLPAILLAVVAAA
jgi:hypothetical protein